MDAQSERTFGIDDAFHFLWKEDDLTFRQQTQKSPDKLLALLIIGMTKHNDIGIRTEKGRFVLRDAFDPRAMITRYPLGRISTVRYYLITTIDIGKHVAMRDMIVT